MKLFKESVGCLHMADDDKTAHAVGKHKIFVPNSRHPLVYLSYYHWDRTLRICRWDTGKTIHSCKWAQPDQYLTSCFSQDGRTLAVGSDAGTVHVYRVNDRKVKRTLNNSRYIEHVASLSAHSRRVISVYISSAFSTILSGSDDYSLIVWDLNRLTYTRSIQHEGRVSCMTMNASTGDIASFCIDAYTGEHRLYLRTINGDTISQRTLDAEVTCMQFTWVAEGVNRNILVVGMADGKLALLDAFDLHTHTVLDVHNERFSADMQNEYGDTVGQRAPITALSINSSMTEVTTGDENGLVCSFRVA